MGYDASSSDAQGTTVKPVEPKAFPLDAYHEYAGRMDERVQEFLLGKRSVLVYRRFRVPEVYAGSCGDMALSLSLQLAALRESMAYPADMANYLEPWYGMGAVQSAFGAEYEWKTGQAPCTLPLFETLGQALDASTCPVEQTAIGRATLLYIDYFLENTRGLIPLSYSDVQSPLNVMGSLLPISDLFLEMMDEPEQYALLQTRVCDLMEDFFQRQRRRIGSALAKPGHGFASSRRLEGFGMADDDVVMLSNQAFIQREVKARERLGARFGGAAFHSCGNWARCIPAVRRIGNLRFVDGAFSPETDPDPNEPEPFAEAFAGTEVIVNARMVGSACSIVERVRRLYRPGLRLIVNTYCRTPAEQKLAYEGIHAVCD